MWPGDLRAAAAALGQGHSSADGVSWTSTASPIRPAPSTSCPRSARSGPSSSRSDRTTPPGSAARFCSPGSATTWSKPVSVAAGARIRRARHRVPPPTAPWRAGWWDFREPAAAARRRSPPPLPWSRPSAGRYVSVLDLNRTFSALSFLLDVEPGGGLVDLLSTVARASLHPEMVEGVRAQRSDRIAVYGYPWSLEPPPLAPVVGGVRAAGGAAAPVASRDRRRHGTTRPPARRCSPMVDARVAGGGADGHRSGFGGPDDGAHPPDARSGVAVPARAEPYPCVRERSRRARARAGRSRGRSRRGRAVRARGAGGRRPRLAGGPPAPHPHRAAGQAHGPAPGHARAREERGRHPRSRPIAGGVPPPRPRALGRFRMPRGFAGPSRASPVLSALRRLVPLGATRPRPA